MAVETDNLELALAAIRKEYGAGSVRAGDKFPEIPRIPTGSLELDIATNGGVPVGRMSHFYGGYMSCKSLTTLNVARNAQAMGQTVALYNAEKQYDKDWWEARGVKTKDLVVVEKTVIEDIGAALETLLPSVHLHIIDSMAAAVSKDELAADADEWRPGRSAAAWGKALRRAQAYFDDQENTLIMINQTRDVFQGRGEETPTGGRMIEFLSSLSLYFRRSSWLFRDKYGNLHPEGSSVETLSGDLTPAGMEFMVRAKKSRVGPPLRTARMRLDFDTGTFDEVWTLFKGAVHYGILKKSGSWFEFPDGKKLQGEGKVRELLTKDEELAEMVRAKMIEAYQ